MFTIDTHTHFFTGERTQADIKYLQSIGLILSGQNGAIEGLKKRMKEDGVNISINAPTAINPEQVHSINKMMIEYNQHETNIICLGTLHPDMTNPAEEAAYLASKGIKGVKMHPQVQNFFPDDESMKKIYTACENEDLYILLHAGAGSEPVYDYDTIKGTPKRISDVLDSYPLLKFVIAHLGGLNMWNEARKYLIGKNVYLDTAYCTIMPDEEFINIVKHHGADKILFGSDYPWIRQADIATLIERTIEDERKRELIFHKNAEILLDL
ncbi:MAG: amidohydrolase family protein [bacterium]